jgi:hypothetical protein
MMKPVDEESELSMTEWVTKFGDGREHSETAELAAKFMFAMSYYHDRMRLHIMLHPLFFVAGFAAAYWLL